MLHHQVAIDVSPPTRPGARRFAVLAVAFLGAVLMLVGPWNTQDKANALAIAPIIAAVGEAGALPASILEFTPPGFAITAAAALGWLAWDNRDQLAAWGSDAWCWIQNCPTTNKPHSVDATGTLAPEVHPTGTVYNNIAWTLNCSGEACTAATSCSQPRPPGAGWPDFCTPGNLGTSPGAGALVSVCVATAAGAADPVLVGRTPGGVTIGVSSYTAPATNHQFAVTAPYKWMNDGSSFNVCPSGYRVARAEWWPTTSGATTDMAHGYYSQGNVPTDSRVDMNCKPAGGGAAYKVTGTIVTDPAGDGSAGVHPPTCNAGDVALSEDVCTRASGDVAFAPCQNVPLQQAPADQVANFGDCLDTAGVSTGLCTTDVWLNQDGTAGFTKCAVGNPIDCLDWEAYAATYPDRVQCRFGTHVMPLTDCKARHEAYYTGRTATNDGGANWYASNPDGTPAPKTNPNPSPNPTPAPTPAPSPGGTTVHDPAFDPQPSNNNCWGGMISWNPVDWVLTPIKCAVEWAVVPNQTQLQPKLDSMKAQLRTTTVGAYVDGLITAAQTTNVPAGGGCQGPAFSGILPAGGGPFTVHPFDACSGPVKIVAAIVKAGLSAGIIVACLFFGVRVLAGTFGMKLPSGSAGTEEDVA